MGKFGIMKPVVMLAFLGIILIVLINPISGDPMNQGNMNMAGQENMMASCPCSGMHMMHCHCMIMGDHAGNETMLGDMMGDHFTNETMMMPCMMGNNSTDGMMHCMMMHGNPANESNGTMVYCHRMMGDHAGNMSMMMGNNSSNKTMMMPCMMMGNDSNNGLMHCPCMMNQNISSSQRDLDCAAFWLKKAIDLHDMHIKDPSTATNESQMEMMDQMMKAYTCLTGENMTENMTHDMMTNTTVHMSGVH